MDHRNIKNMVYTLFTVTYASRAYSRVKLLVIGGIHQVAYTVTYIVCVHKYE